MNENNEQIVNTFGAMAWAVFVSVGLYIALPMLAAAIVLRLLGVRGQAHKALLSIIGVICLFLFAKYGFSYYLEVYENKLK